MANDSEFHCSFQELIFIVNMNLNKTILQSAYLIFVSLLFAIVEFKASVKTPLIKRSQQKDKLNRRLVL